MVLGGVAVVKGVGLSRRDDGRGEMQIFPVCLFLSILWIYVAFPVMK